MWLWMAICSAVLLGVYDVAKKQALKRNGVLWVLLGATALTTLFLCPFLSAGTPEHHLRLVFKAVLVTASWVTGLLGVKMLPLTTVSTIKGSRPVFVVVLSVLLFGERLNVWQWLGIAIAITAMYLLGLSSRKEGISVRKNRGFVYMALSVLTGAASALYDKHIMADMEPMFVQSWTNAYITLLLALIIFFRWLKSHDSVERFRWDWTIVLIAGLITIADALYFISLKQEGALLSVISMVRRGSIIITFILGAVLFREHNIRGKALDLCILVAGIALLLLATGTKKQPERLHILVGTYTEGSGSEGIYLYSFDTGTAEAALLDTAKAGNPSFIIPSADRRFAYSVSEYSDGRQGVCSFTLCDTAVNPLNFQPGAGADPCNIVITGGNAITSDYSGGTVSSFPVLADGSLGEISFQYRPDTSDGIAPHIHCAAVSPDGKYVFLNDLGRDAIYRASLDGGSHPTDFVTACQFDATVHPGPRHICFSKDGRHAYLIGETADMLYSFRYRGGKLEPTDGQLAYDGGGCGSADIHISPDGRFVYTSHRLKEDGIAIFRRNRLTGKLTPAGYRQTGRHPRNFAITPDGTLLLCACRDDNRIEIYSIDRKTGALSDTGKHIGLPAPVCISLY